MTPSDRLAAFHQYAVPMALFFMSMGLVVVLVFAGLAMLQGTLEAASFVAVATGFFGLMSGALGITSQRASQRSSDTPNGGTTNAPPTVTITGPGPTVINPGP